MKLEEKVPAAAEKANAGKTEGSFTSFTYDNIEFKSAADVGNYHAGYTGTFCGISYKSQWIGAGAAEMTKNREWTKMMNPMTFVSAPYGDRTIDYKWNTRGMDDAASELNIKGPDLTATREIDN